MNEMTNFNRVFEVNESYDAEKEEVDTPEIIPEESEKYRDMRPIEVISDYDGIIEVSFSYDKRRVFLITGDTKQELKVFDRDKGGKIRFSTKEPRMSTRMFSDVQDAQRGQAYIYRVGSELVCRENSTNETVYSIGPIPFGGVEITDGTKVACSNIGNSSIMVFDLDRGDKRLLENREYRFPSSYQIATKSGGIAAVFGREILVSDENIENYRMKLSGHTGEVSTIAETQDGKHLISVSVNRELKVWDKENGVLALEIGLQFGISLRTTIEETNDKKHFIICNGEKIYIINKESQGVVAVYNGTSFSQMSNGGLIALDDGKVVFWHWGGGRNEAPTEIVISKDRVLTPEERFSEFKTVNFALDEFSPGWNQVTNLEAKGLEKRKKFVWGNERIYFDVPLSKLETLRDLSIAVARDEKVAISFKYLDLSDQEVGEIAEDATRFVANFASVGDAKRFYQRLSTKIEYQSIVSDRQTNHLAYNIDGKAHYAQGFRELRAEEVEDFQAILENISENDDGTYTLVTREGKIKLNEKEYQELINFRDFGKKFERIWEEEK